MQKDFLKGKRVCLLGLGPSLSTFVNITKNAGSPAILCEEVWGINAVANVIRCDRVFHMDDMTIQGIRAAARPESNIAAMIEGLRTHPAPIYTSIVRDGWPGLVAFPLVDVLNDVGCAYMNSTAAYAVAFAIWAGVKKLTLFGCDFTYARSHDAEKGRAGVEFWLGAFHARGGEIGLSRDTSLMDACEPLDKRLYGYDAVELNLRTVGHRTYSIEPKERTSLPTADEIEAAYDHEQHPNPLMTAAEDEESNQDRAGD